MKSLKQVKETGEYKTQKKDGSSSEEEYEQNASDDDWDQVEVNTSSSNETSDEDSVPAKPLPIIYDCESTAADIYKDHIVEIAATAILPEHISSSSLITNQFFSIAGVHIKKNSSSRNMYKRLKLYHTMALESSIIR